MCGVWSLNTFADSHLKYKYYKSFTKRTNLCASQHNSSNKKKKTSEKLEIKKCILHKWKCACNWVSYYSSLQLIQLTVDWCCWFHFNWRKELDISKRNHKSKEWRWTWRDKRNNKTQWPVNDMKIKLLYRNDDRKLLIEWKVKSEYIIKKREQSRGVFRENKFSNL